MTPWRTRLDQRAEPATDAAPTNVAEPLAYAPAGIVADRALGLTLDDLTRGGNRAFNRWLERAGSTAEPAVDTADAAMDVDSVSFGPELDSAEPEAAGPDLRQQVLQRVGAAVIAHVEAESEKGRKGAISKQAVPFARDAIPLILAASLDQGVRDVRQVAYILATAQHESRFGGKRFDWSEPLIEDHNKYNELKNGTWRATVHTNGIKVTGATKEELDRNYWDKAYGGRLGNDRDDEDDAATYRGRGYVQLTGEDNYGRLSKRLNEIRFAYTHNEVTYGGEFNHLPIDLVRHPTHVNEVPELAARILTLGSAEGLFSGRSLGRYINDQATDSHAAYTNARWVINKQDRVPDIADIAVGYENVLRPFREDWGSVVSPPPPSATRRPARARRKKPEAARN